MGGCSLGQTGALWQHVGATTTGNWVRIERNGASQFGAFGVNPHNPNHIIANDRSGPTPVMVRTFDGGASWSALAQLDAMLTGNGDFLAQTQMGPRPGDTGYPQASLVAINPADSDMVVAAGQDSGVFLSLDGGNSWHLMTDPRTNNALRPHLSRPLFAHFETFLTATLMSISARAGAAPGASRSTAPPLSLPPTSMATERAMLPSEARGGSAGWKKATAPSPHLRSNRTAPVSAAGCSTPTTTGWDRRRSRRRRQKRDRLREPLGHRHPPARGTTYGAYAGAQRHPLRRLAAQHRRQPLRPCRDFDGDGRAEILITSPWGMGVFELSGSTFTVAGDGAERHPLRRLAAQHRRQPVRSGG